MPYLGSRSRYVAEVLYGTNAELTLGPKDRVVIESSTGTESFPTEGWLEDGRSPDSLNPPSDQACFDQAFVWLTLAAWYRKSARFDKHQRWIPEGQWLTPGFPWHHAVLDEKFKRTAPNFYKEGLTVDVDCLYKFRGRTIWKQLGGSLRDAARGDVLEVRNRIQVILGKSQDPWDFKVEDWQERVHRVFWLVSDGGKFNPNIPIHHPGQKQRLEEWASTGKLSLHPSYHVLGGESCKRPSHVNIEIWEKEYECLNKLTDQKADRFHFRNHYLRWSPDWYRFMESKGYKYAWNGHLPGYPGYHQGTAYPFPWYDLEQERTSQLWIIPAAFMDGDFKYYRKISLEEVKKILKQNPGGTGIWHNESLSDFGPWKGWADVAKKYHG